jgi:hypothetical protein
MTDSPPARLRLGMVGGGRGAFIGETHRIAARLDDRYELIAGALSADPQRAIESGRPAKLANEAKAIIEHEMTQAFVEMFGNEIPCEVEAKVCANWGEK